MRRWHSFLAWVALIACMLAGCGNGSHSSSASATATVIPTGTASVLLGQQPCPTGVSASFYATLLALTPDQHVETLACADLRHDGTLEVVLGVRLDGTGAYLNVYVYSLPDGTTATQLFFDLGLYKGSVAISRVSTLLLGAVDQQDCVNASATSDVAYQASWNQEIGWNGTGFAPVVFPGFYPDLTRLIAEATQLRVDGGMVAPATPTAIVNQFFTQQLHYPAADPGTTLLSSNGWMAQVQSFGWAFTLQQLIETGQQGIWEITDIAPQSILSAPSVPAALAQVHSPVSFSAASTATSGNPFAITIFDHAGCAIGHTSLPAIAGPLTASLAYTADPGVQVGPNQGTLAGTAWQEGTLWISQRKPDGTYTALHIVKLLLG
jgi:hypothetical protein